MWRVLAGLVLAVVMLGAAAAALGAAYRLGDHAGADRRDTAWRAAETTRLAAQLAAERKAAQAAATVDAAHADQAERIRVVYRTLEREIPAHVSPEVDRLFPLPVGFVRLHDAAAAGVPAGAVPDPAGRPDAAASEIAASLAARTIVGNYEACTDTAERLSALQAFVRGVAITPTP